ncbi:MAG: hypothetical protein M3N21_09280 [Actinomycetota bacterium]|nr:hypothetical protein [Actinomycetota bacterium]
MPSAEVAGIIAAVALAGVFGLPGVVTFGLYQNSSARAVHILAMLGCVAVAVLGAFVGTVQYRSAGEGESKRVLAGLAVGTSVFAGVLALFHIWAAAAAPGLP